MIQVTGLEPIHPDYGLYEGTPIARYYIDNHMRRIAPTLRGRILEFGRPTYAASLACEPEIIDIDPDNATATIHADICDENVARQRSRRYDAILCTAVLQLVADPQKAVRNMRAMLKPGGSLVVAEKGFSQIDPWSGDVDRWRFTPEGLRLLLGEFARVDVRSYGNVYVLCAYLLGLPAEQMEAESLEHHDPRYPLVTVARAEG